MTDYKAKRDAAAEKLCPMWKTNQSSNFAYHGFNKGADFGAAFVLESDAVKGLVSAVINARAIHQGTYGFASSSHFTEALTKFEAFKKSVEGE